jgi:hypothetical protein
MANEIFGAGVTVNSATYTGDPAASAIYSNGDTLSPIATPGNTGVILSTGQAQAFTTVNPTQSNISPSTTTPNSGGSGLGPGTTDSSFLSINFTPTGNTLTLQFVFSSEEFPEFVGTQFNDRIVITVNGVPVQLSVAGDAGSVGSINAGANPSLYIDNTGSLYNTEMDGFTATLSLNMAVNPNVPNTIVIGVADVGDDQYDSNLLIAGNSAQTVFIANDDQRSLLFNQEKTLDILANDTSPPGSVLTLTHINGIAVTAGSQITLSTGQIITVNADGTIKVQADGDDETVSFSYTAQTDTGVSASAFVTIDTVPCFTAGTLIDTPAGPRRIESLGPGDLVLTRDNGPQPLRWIGRRSLSATGSFAPVRIAAGGFGATHDVLVSPLHRILVRAGRAELLFDSTEVLVAARDLIDGRTVTRVEGGTVDYVHILFDRHQVVCTSGLASESFLPGPQTRACLESAMVEEICAIFPALDPATGGGYGSAARRTLRPFEARLLVA